MSRYPKEIYLQGNLNLFKKRTVRQDTRLHLNWVDGEDPGPTQRPNNAIPLLAWLLERIDEGDLSIVTSETNLTANDSTTIDFTTSGTANHTLTGSVIIPALISSDPNNSVELGTDDKLFVDLTGLQSQINELETNISILQNTINNLISIIDVCCVQNPLDITFNPVVQLCSQSVTFPESISFEITLNASGTDYGSFYTLTQAKFITPTGVPNTENTTTYAYYQGLNLSGGNPKFMFAAGQAAALLADGGTVEFTIEFLDGSSNHHFVKFTAVVPNDLLGADLCEFNIPMTVTFLGDLGYLNIT